MRQTETLHVTGTVSLYTGQPVFSSVIPKMQFFQLPQMPDENTVKHRLQSFTG